MAIIMSPGRAASSVVLGGGEWVGGCRSERESCDFEKILDHRKPQIWREVQGERCGCMRGSRQGRLIKLSGALNELAR